MGNAVMAGGLLLAPLMATATFRRNLPYAILLVALDVMNNM